MLAVGAPPLQPRHIPPSAPRAFRQLPLAVPFTTWPDTREYVLPTIRLKSLQRSEPLMSFVLPATIVDPWRPPSARADALVVQRFSGNGQRAPHFANSQARHRPMWRTSAPITANPYTALTPPPSDVTMVDPMYARRHNPLAAYANPQGTPTGAVPGVSPCAPSRAPGPVAACP